MKTIINEEGKRVEISDEMFEAQYPSVPVLDASADYIPVAMLRQRVEMLGMWDEFAAYLVQNPGEMLKVLTVDRGLVDPAYPALQVAFDSMDVPAAARSYILAPPAAGVPDVG